MPQSVVISCVDNLPGKASLAEGGLMGGKGGAGRRREGGWWEVDWAEIKHFPLSSFFFKTLIS